ncbi:MAG TPA: hypothetical protein VID68_04180 [Solirubrobacteraceae bacterium]|jgi:hypothetical protein
METASLDLRPAAAPRPVQVLRSLRPLVAAAGGRAGEAPAEPIVRDRVLLPVTLAWMLLFTLGIHVAR